MKTRMVEQREGEWLGPVDWDYPFIDHMRGMSTTDDAAKQAECDKKVAQLRKLVGGGNWEATTDGGWPRVGYGPVLNVGMYDGWPYWRPVPSVLILGTIGASWHPFDHITGIEKEKTRP